MTFRALNVQLCVQHDACEAGWQRVYLFVVFRLYAQFETSYPAARRYAPLHPSPPIAADLRPCADRSAVRTALVACRAAALPIAYGASGLGAACLGQLGQTDGSRYRLMPPYGGEHNSHHTVDSVQIYTT